ncbi:transposase [Candidatus Sumerlaeota bacterium]|nr:transposase [Candidatus Sumerlaeota bacterium]
MTSDPKLESSIELKEITATLIRADEESFTRQLNQWYEKWKDFLKQKTINPETGRWNYTHKRLRSAYRSLKTNLPYLFTYLKYPELNIPNTTNSLDGYFNVLKSKLNVHRGLNDNRSKKIIIELLKGEN